MIRPKGQERTLLDDSVSERILNENVYEMEDLYNSFTICCIKDIPDKHKDKFKSNVHSREDLNFWTKQLARIYKLLFARH